MTRHIGMRGVIAALNSQTRLEFRSLGKQGGGRYTPAQKDMALDLVGQHGVRGTSRILKLNRRTIQVWLRQAGKAAPACPPWLVDWVERRAKKDQEWR